MSRQTDREKIKALLNGKKLRSVGPNCDITGLKLNKDGNLVECISNLAFTSEFLYGILKDYEVKD
jgi:hypothetical protein